MKTYLNFFFIFSIFFLLSCEDEKKEEVININFNVVMENDGQITQLNELIALDNNMDIKLSMFRLYLSNIILTTNDGEKVDLAEVKLMDVGSDVNNSFSASIKKGNYTSLYLGLGLDPELNASDPTSFPDEHPLSSYQTMYWGMIKYRFVKLGGMANTHGNFGNNDILIALHPGTDPLFKEKTFNIDLNLTEATSASITLLIDINELFAASNAFNFQTEAQSHSGTPNEILISEKFMEELEKSVMLETNIQ